MKGARFKSISPMNQYGNLVPMPFSSALWQIAFAMAMS